MRFVYVMDPMCAWCFGFGPELEAFLSGHASARVEWVMGGLAPDNTEPMEQSLRDTIASYWHQIEQRTQVSFNHDYWHQNTPYRSTYQACRAVIVAQTMKENGAEAMSKAIQSAYYQQAANPSLDATLAACAVSIGLDEAQFLSSLNAQDTQAQLQQHLALTRQLQVGGFPALFYVTDENYAYALTLGYCQASELSERFTKIHQAASQ
ncbi:DsbA family protein [Pseudoalteromonas luteoviolacea]|uniref:DsbA family protein n=1 Tax=Pseudoalteromonas luteoviolacea TaxID=43657 RepID=UPI001F1754C5|nr:DsbA family protein [Pseudoalteromonas luteoviolacea]MCF6438751.1 DsbA family protein [Pseudoalteromonas luteoviolacea]